MKKKFISKIFRKFKKKKKYEDKRNKEYFRDYHRKNRERINNARRERLKIPKNRKKTLAYHREYYKKNREKCLLYARESYYKNKGIKTKRK